MIIDSESGNFKVSLKVVGKYTLEQELMLKQAVRIMANRIGSQGFKQFCEDYKYRYTTSTGMWWWKTVHTHHQGGFKFPNGLSGAEIYQSIMHGAETLSPVKNRTADMELTIDTRNKRSVLGYTYPNSVRQYMYSWLLKTTPERVAGNLAHEWCHKLGFDHKHRYNSTRRHSVPYAVGDFVAGIVR